MNTVTLTLTDAEAGIVQAGLATFRAQLKSLTDADANELITRVGDLHIAVGDARIAASAAPAVAGSGDDMAGIGSAPAWTCGHCGATYGAQHPQALQLWIERHGTAC